MTQLLLWFAGRLSSLRSEKGNAAEYGLIIALISVAIIIGATIMGGALNTLFNAVGGVLGANTP